MQSFTATTWKRVVGMATIAGLRFCGGPALISWRASHGDLPALRHTPFAWFGSRLAAYGSATGLLMESVADKTLDLPGRTDPLPLASRAVAGALTGAMLFATEEAPPVQGALFGAGFAMLGATVATLTRAWASSRLRIPDALLGLVEDGLIVAAFRLAKSAPKPGRSDS